MALAASTCSSSSPVSMVSELMAQGRESAAALEALLRGAPAPAHGGGAGAALQDLAAQILRCCDRALAALHAGAVDVDVGEAAGRKRGRPGSSGSRAAAALAKPPKRRARGSGGGETPTRVETRCTAEDGFIWRKYGQKDIQNSKYPRLYFRCTYKFDNGCRATRQVQQSEDDPSLYVITYYGEHTCCGGAAAVAGEDDGSMQPFVINFGSATASSGGGGSGGSLWLSSSDDDARSVTSHSPQAVCLPAEERDKMCTMGSPAAAATEEEEPSSSFNASRASPSPVPEPFSGCLDWDFIGDISSFDGMVEFVSFDSEIPLFQ